MEEAAALPAGERPGDRRLPGPATGGAGDEGRIEDVLAQPLVAAVEALGGYGGLVYLRSRDRRSLVLCVVAGMPRSLLRPWWRVPVGAALPMAEAYRSGERLWLPDERATMLRFPQFTAALPYSFASAHQPVSVGGETVGVLVVLRSATREPLGEAAVVRVLHDAGRSTEERLAGFVRRAPAPVAADTGTGASAAAEIVAHRTEYDGQPVGVRLPAPPAHPLRLGMVEWDLDSDRWWADDEALALLGLAREDFDGTTAGVEARVAPDDAHELRACRSDARAGMRIGSRHFRVLGEGAEGGRLRYRPVELWGHVVRAGSAGRLLVGALVEATGGVTAAEAAERLPDGLFSLDQDGRVTYANRRCVELLGRERDELLGHPPWQVIDWLHDPHYEDRYRAAMLSQEPVSYAVQDPEGAWLGFVLYPGVHGLTGRVFRTGPPAGATAGPVPEAGTAPGEGTAGAAPPGADSAVPPPEAVAPPRAGALYHVVQMASALTEAVTVRDVCRAVSEQLLPAFGAHELALYAVHEGRMHLLWESGYPEGFLDAFEGVPLETELPGVHALTTRLPLFFESPEALISAYPGISLDRMRAWSFLPLVASGRPVGSCILGWETSRRFTPDERSALIALGGLVAQALERARLYDAESAVARGLQEGLLPHRLPAIEGLVSTGRYLPGTQGMAIGGDWYDVIRTERGVALVIGDVEGHSVGAAAVMGQLRSAVHAFAASGHPPQEVVTHTNRLLADLEADAFATCCYIELDPDTGRAFAVRAGHPPPLLRHPDGRTEALDLVGGVMLGVEANALYPVTAFTLAPGSVLALYTDGLVEQPGSDIGTGIEAVRRAFAHSGADSVEELADQLVGPARGVEDRPDDVALLLAAYRRATGA
ncbi:MULTISPECIES: SpoIIE family protein phosphatase [unclassified Streptomyces]|uniref:SpoIIE family protein phosphatase n=1 Tax=unclassified Streptomyces TaxID=2593676 RepID=UPI0007EC8EE5|nr:MULTISPECIES: SpoIIE family protein phosphatase [unclassified Streptomyces]MCP3768149.1 SpoIIE family protein phosphatase [Streptomyces sp. MAR25Y5]OBQ46807.1 phosphatase [Streptomyces sp. H-KF8]